MRRRRVQIEEPSLWLKEAMLEHVHTVVVQVGILLPCELTNTHTCVDSPRFQQFVSDLGDNDQFLAGGEGDVALVEQVVYVRRQQQSVGAIEPFGVGRV